MLLQLGAEGGYGLLLLLHLGAEAVKAHRYLLLLHRHGGGHGSHGGVAAAIIGQGPGAAEHMDADAALVMDEVQELDEADLTRIVHVGSAAGAEILGVLIGADADDADAFGEVQLGTVGEGGQLVGIGVVGLDGEVGGHDGVGLLLDGVQLGAGQHAVKVQGHVCGFTAVAQVEAHIFVAVEAVDDARDNMLAAVVLHAGEAGGGVQLTLYGGTHREGVRRTVQVGHADGMGDDTVCLLNVQDGTAREEALVGVLTAALGEEGGSVQHHGQGVGGLADFGGEDGGGEGVEVAVLIEEAGGFHGNSCVWVVVSGMESGAVSAESGVSSVTVEALDASPRRMRA